MENFYYIDKQSKKTLIFIQGGPIGYNFMKNDVDKDKINSMFWLYMDLVKEIPNLFSQYNIAAINQEQYKDPNKSISSKEEAYSIISKTLKTMHDTINYFYGLGHQILLIGHSYGGYLILEYLKDYTNDKIHRIVIANCRIKTPSIFPEYIIKENKIPFINDKDEFVGFRNFDSDPYQYKLILYHTMKNDYSKKLNSLDLSNVIYLSSYPDKWLGILQQDEINWALSKGSKIIETNLLDIEGFKDVVKINLKTDTLAHNSIFFSKIVNKIKKIL